MSIARTPYRLKPKAYEASLRDVQLYRNSQQSLLMAQNEATILERSREGYSVIQPFPRDPNVGRAAVMKQRDAEGIGAPLVCGATMLGIGLAIWQIVGPVDVVRAGSTCCLMQSECDSGLQCLGTGCDPQKPGTCSINC